MPAISRLGDTSTHGGSIISASSNVKVNGLGVARNGDILQCPAHGPKPIASSAKNKVNGRSIVTVGCVAACGAVITTGSSNTNTL